MGICCMAQGTNDELKHGLCDDLQVCDGEGDGREGYMADSH